MVEMSLLLLFIAAGLYMGYPFWRPKVSSKDISTDDRSLELDAQKQALLMAIKEIEFDHQMGKLSDEDFQELNRQYRMEAIAILKRMDQLRGDGDREEELEEEILSYRRRQKLLPRQQREDSYCPRCGQRVGVKARFCSQCGEKL